MIFVYNIKCWTVPEISGRKSLNLSYFLCSKLVGTIKKTSLLFKSRSLDIHQIATKFILTKDCNIVVLFEWFRWSYVLNGPSVIFNVHQWNLVFDSYFLLFHLPLVNTSFIWCRCWWMALTCRICSTLVAFEHGGIFIVPRRLWRSSLYHPKNRFIIEPHCSTSTGYWGSILSHETNAHRAVFMIV